MTSDKKLKAFNSSVDTRSRLLIDIFHWKLFDKEVFCTQTSTILLYWFTAIQAQVGINWKMLSAREFTNESFKWPTRNKKWPRYYDYNFLFAVEKICCALFKFVKVWGWNAIQSLWCFAGTEQRTALCKNFFKTFFLQIRPKQ